MKCDIALPDLPARLNETICLYEDIPYIVMIESPNSNVISLYDMVSKHFIKNIKSNDSAFDVATPPLGYAQVKPDRVTYVNRLPHRQFKQGITSSVLNYEFFTDPLRVPLRSAPMRDMMAKVYPSLEFVIKTLIKSEKSYIELAVSNDCAIVKGLSGSIKIYFKHTEVGFTTLTELKKKEPVIHISSSSPKSWIVNRYLSHFDWVIKE